MKDVIVISHANCNDGSCAAGVLYDKYPDAEFIFMNHTDLLDLSRLKDKHVVFVDFSMKRDVMERIAVLAETVLILDHHKSAEKNLIGLDVDFENTSLIFDMIKSGAMISWEYFNKGMNPPYVVKLVQDRDIWTWDLMDTAAFSAGVMIRDYTERDWCDLLYNGHIVNDIIIEGEIILKYQENLLKFYKENKPRIREIAGHYVPFIPCTHLISEVGNILSKNKRFSCTYFDLENERVYSLRSDKDYPLALDVSEIAVSYGGGGHKNAAGFSLPFNDLEFIR